MAISSANASASERDGATGWAAAGCGLPAETDWIFGRPTPGYDGTGPARSTQGGAPDGGCEGTADSEDDASCGSDDASAGDGDETETGDEGNGSAASGVETGLETADATGSEGGKTGATRSGGISDSSTGGSTRGRPGSGGTAPSFSGDSNASFIETIFGFSMMSLYEHGRIKERFETAGTNNERSVMNDTKTKEGQTHSNSCRHARQSAQTGQATKSSVLQVPMNVQGHTQVRNGQFVLDDNAPVARPA